MKREKLRIEFVYNPVNNVLILKVKTPKYLRRRIEKTLNGENKIDNDVLTITKQFITLKMPIRPKYRLQLLPEMPKDYEYMLLFSDEVIDYIHTLYTGVVKSVEDVENELHYIKKMKRKIIRELRIFDNIETLKEKVSTLSYYYLINQKKALNLKLHYLKVEEKKLQKTKKILFIIMDALHYLTKIIIENYPIITIDYTGEDYTVNVNDTRITLRKKDYKDLREIIKDNSDILQKAIVMYKNDIIEDINRTQQEIIKTQSFLSELNKVLQELDNEKQKHFKKYIEQDIKQVEQELKTNEHQIENFKVMLKSADKLFNTISKGGDDEQ